MPAPSFFPELWRKHLICGQMPIGAAEAVPFRKTVSQQMRDFCAEDSQGLALEGEFLVGEVAVGGDDKGVDNAREEGRVGAQVGDVQKQVGGDG